MSSAAIRDSVEADLAAIHRIYAHHVETGLGSFEETAPGRDELARRRADILARGLPYIVATDAADRVLGYSYAGPYRTRSAYRFTLENSVYVAPGAARGGVGSALLAELIRRCTALGYRQLVAVIGDSANAGSIGLHAALGFRRIGVIEGVGWKHGIWVDSVLMQLPLAAGNGAPPA